MLSPAMMSLRVGDYLTNESFVWLWQYVRRGSNEC